MSSVPGEKIPLAQPDASNPKTSANGGSNGERDYSFLFKEARYGGEGSAYNGSSNRQNRDDNRKSRRNDSHEGAPDDNDPDDNDDNDDSGDSQSLLGSSNIQHSNTDLKPRSRN